MSIIDEFLKNEYTTRLLDFNIIGRNGAQAKIGDGVQYRNMCHNNIYYILVDDGFLYLIKGEYDNLHHFLFDRSTRVLNLDNQIKSRLKDNKISIEELTTLIEFHKL